MKHWKKIVRLSGTLLLILTVGCNNADHSPVGQNKAIDSLPKNVSLKDTSMPAPDTIFAGNMDTMVVFKDGEAFIVGHIIANRKQPKYTVSGKKGETVTATIRSLKKGGNVRINQVQQPGGAFDGPFGDSLSYTFKKNGSLRFIIGENLMAGDPYTGDFIFHVILK